MPKPPTRTTQKTQRPRYRVFEDVPLTSWLGVSWCVIHIRTLREVSRSVLKADARRICRALNAAQKGK